MAGVMARQKKAKQPAPGQKNKARNTKRRQKNKVKKQTIKLQIQPRSKGRRTGRGRGSTRRGPRAAVTQQVTATLGTVGVNSGNKVELEMSALINPALIKEVTGSNQFGPIQIYAATYSQWRLKHLKLMLTPLVGASAVSGTVVRASLNMSATPSSSSWSALGARKHVDTTPGRPATFVLQARDIPGPKEGWFNTLTKGDPLSYLGGALEIHTYGKTMSTYQAKEFEGQLFLVEMTATWEFANFSPSPGMLNLVKGDSNGDTGNITIKAQAGEPIEIDVPSTTRFARASGGDGSASEIIWQVVDTAVDVATSAFPPPFNWLFSGGWWFIKKVAGKSTRAGVDTFRVYSSIQDANTSTPCIASVTQDTTIPVNGFNYIQVTPGNTGLAESSGQVGRAVEPLDPDTVLWPNEYQVIAGLESSIGPLLFNYVRSPQITNFQGFCLSSNSTRPDASNTVPLTFAYKVTPLDPSHSGVYQMTANGYVDSTPNTNGVPLYAMSRDSSNTATMQLVGQVYASQSITLRPNNATRQVQIQTFLAQITRTGRYRVDAGACEGHPATMNIVASGNRFVNQIQTGNVGSVTLTYNADYTNGEWYVLMNYNVSPTNVFTIGDFGVARSTEDTQTNGYWNVTSLQQFTGLSPSPASPLKFQRFNSTTITRAAAEPPNLYLEDEEDYAELVEACRLALQDAGLEEDTDTDTDSETDTDTDIYTSEDERYGGRPESDDDEPQGAAAPLPNLVIKEIEEFEEDPDDPNPIWMQRNSQRIKFKTIVEEAPEPADGMDKCQGCGLVGAHPTCPPMLRGEHYSTPPLLIITKLSAKGRKVRKQLRDSGFDDHDAVRMAQAVQPHPSLTAFQDVYKNSLYEGFSPVTAREIAWCSAVGALNLQ